MGSSTSVWSLGEANARRLARVTNQGVHQLNTPRSGHLDGMARLADASFRYVRHDCSSPTYESFICSLAPCHAGPRPRESDAIAKPDFSQFGPRRVHAASQFLPRFRNFPVSDCFLAAPSAPATLFLPAPHRPRLLSIASQRIRSSPGVRTRSARPSRRSCP